MNITQHDDEVSVRTNRIIRAKLIKGIDCLIKEKSEIRTNLSFNQSSARYDAIVSKFHEIMKILNV